MLALLVGEETPHDILDGCVHGLWHSVAVDLAVACLVKKAGAHLSIAHVVTLGHRAQGQIVEQVAPRAGAVAGRPGGEHLRHLAVAGGIGLAGFHFCAAALTHLLTRRRAGCVLATLTACFRVFGVVAAFVAFATRIATAVVTCFCLTARVTVDVAIAAVVGAVLVALAAGVAAAIMSSVTAGPRVTRAMAGWVASARVMALAALIAVVASMSSVTARPRVTTVVAVLVISALIVAHTARRGTCSEACP